MTSFFYVYIIECFNEDNKRTFYVGFTTDINRRIHEHYDKRGAKYTKSHRLGVYGVFKYKDKSEALREEKRIKKLSPRQKLDLLIEKGVLGCVI